MRHKSGLFFLFGAWLSFIGVLVGGASFIPVTKTLRAQSPAAVYRAALHEEMREATTLPIEGKVIVINESGMKLSLYQDGTSTKAFRISVLASPFSLFEAPTGSYVISAKEPEHLSRKSLLWMPYALSFGDDLFIHGVPHSKQGEEQEQADGVSVELATLDAKEVYDFASLGVKVIVTGGYPRALFASSSRYYLFGEGKLPKITAPSFIVRDMDSNATLWERSADLEVKAGGIVPLGVALTAVETLDQYKNVRIGKLLLNGKAAEHAPPSHDDELPLGSLIYPLLFDANQTAANALAKEAGNAAFTRYMNDRAHSLSMWHTSFSSSALFNESTTSARDLSTLLGYIYDREHFLLDVSLSSNRAIFASSGRMRYQWENKNPWVVQGDADYQGGFGTLSPSGRGSGMFIFHVPLAEFGERTIAFIVIDSDDLPADITRMKAFITEHYRYGARRNEEVITTGKPQNLLLWLQSLFREDITYDRDT